MTRVAVALLVLGTFVACSGSDDATVTTTTVNPFASGGSTASESATAAPPPQLAAGDCFDSDGFDATGSIDIAAVRLVPCTDPHQHEVFALVTHSSGPAAPYPGDPAIDAFASDRCLAEFAAYVGTDYQRSSLDTAAARPDAARWSAGDRTIVCTAHDADFAPLIGSVRGTAR